ncbi:MAG: hypothetical protein M3273_08245, partial [Actinomycetota bacterium]|nr:hypothetical protein [Actinomycetota bacterium]
RREAALAAGETVGRGAEERAKSRGQTATGKPRRTSSARGAATAPPRVEAPIPSSPPKATAPDLVEGSPPAAEVKSEPTEAPTEARSTGEGGES